MRRYLGGPYSIHSAIIPATAVVATNGHALPRWTGIDPILLPCIELGSHYQSLVAVLL